MSPLQVLLFLLQILLPLPDATILEDTEIFTLTSPSTGDLKVSKTIEVRNDDGLDAASFYLQGDAFSFLQSFSGTVAIGDSKPVRIKKEDLQVDKDTFSGLVSDDVVYSFTPSGHYPMTVHYEYKVHFQKGFASFPSFVPCDSWNIDVKSASYILNVPKDYPVKYESSRMEYSFSAQKDRDMHCWKVGAFPPVIHERKMPPLLSLVPYVFCSPQAINYGGYSGRQSTWQEVGGWLYQLQDGLDVLSEEEAAQVRVMVAGKESAVEKLQVLYAYFRERTRYVSIQLGIGGLRPMAAKEVSRMGFGDCKGLSIYLKALLAAAGVESYYYVLNTNRAHLFAGYPSPGQMNHAMLAVPLPELCDTAWVECTNPAYPLGYRHSDAAGHNILMVKPEGAFLRIPAYPDSLSVLRHFVDVNLSTDGSASVSVREEAALDFCESFISFDKLPPQKQAKRLAGSLKVQPNNMNVVSISDNFRDYPSLGRKYVPEVDLAYRFDANAYSTVSGTRLFVPVNPFSGSVSIQKSARINPLYQDSAGSMEFLIRIAIPEGYTLETVPAAVSVDSEWGSVTSSFLLSPDRRQISVSQAVRTKSFSEPASKYPSYRDYVREVNKLFSSSLVLVKDQASSR